MKRRFIPLLFLLGAGLLIQSCSEPVTPADGSGSNRGISSFFTKWTVSNPHSNGQIYLTSARVRGNGDATIQSGGQIYNDTSHSTGVNGGTMTISGYTTTDQGNGWYESLSSSPTFGSVATFGLAGNGGVSAFTDSMYVPMTVSISTPAAGANLSKSSNLTVQWNTDNNNDSVIVGFIYEVEVSQVSDSTLPSTQIQWQRSAVDNGSYTIPSSAFTSLPLGGYVRVLVTRGNVERMGASTQKYHVYTYSYASLFMKVVS